MNIFVLFDSSICKDYVTEKFTNALSNFVVPIVLNGGNMTIFPPHSAINIEDFPSLEDLASYLQYLDKNDSAYNAFMQWRYDLSMINSHDAFSPARSSWCQLCEHLHDPGYRSSPYKNAKQWFMEGGKCRGSRNLVLGVNAVDTVSHSANFSAEISRKS